MRYHAMRLRWGGVALLRFMRRWGVYVLIGALVLSAGASSALDVIAAAAAWLVLPLFWAASRGAGLLPMLLLYALAGAALAWGMRPLLWPRRWAEAEAVLPLGRRELLLSDAWMVGFGLVPLMVMQAVGAVSMLAHAPAWLQPFRLRAILALAAAASLAIAAGTALLQWQRQRLGHIRGSRVTHDEVMVRALVQPAGWARVLLWWPLWRGPAKRSAHASMLASAALLVPAIGLLSRPDLAPWWFAAFAALALLGITRVDNLARLDVAPLLDACAMLPLNLKRVRAAHAVLALLPLAPGGVALLLALPRQGVRPAVLAAYVAACIGACAFVVFDHPPEASNRSSRWLFLLIVLLALSSEVMM